MDVSKVANNLFPVTAAQSSFFDEAVQSIPELCANQTWTNGSLAQMTGFLKDHYIEIAARIAGLVAGNRAVMRSVQPGTFPMTMVAAAGFMDFSRAFVGTTTTLACGEALLAAASGRISNASYIYKTALLIEEHSYITTIATISSFIGAILSAKAFDQWCLPAPAVAQAALGSGIITYLTTTLVLASTQRLINSAVSEEGNLYQLGSGVVTTVQDSWNIAVCYLGNAAAFTMRA